MNRIFLILILSFLYASKALSDPCASDPLCHDPGLGMTEFNNQFHYVFVGAHPDDELMIYPFLKDYCAENNAYCAIIIGSRGRMGCPQESLTPEQCGDSREIELEESADYLETDVWQFNNPDGPETMPNNLNTIEAAFNNEAQQYGYSGMVDLLKDKIRKLKTPTSNLLVLAFDPNHGSTGHLDHRVMGALTIQAIDELNAEGLSIAKGIVDTHLYTSFAYTLYLDSYVMKNGGSTQNLICKNGADKLQISNTHLTNYQAFENGFDVIYEKQFTATNISIPSYYNFCFKYYPAP